MVVVVMIIAIKINCKLLQQKDLNLYNLQSYFLCFYIWDFLCILFKVEFTHFHYYYYYFMSFHQVK